MNVDSKKNAINASRGQWSAENVTYKTRIFCPVHTEMEFLEQYQLPTHGKVD